MRKNLTILPILATLVLAGCTPTSPEADIVKDALNELQNNSFLVNLSEELKVLKPNDRYAVDIYQKYEFQIGFYYENEGNGVSYSIESSAEQGDLNKQTGEPIANTVRKGSAPKQTYYKDHETGYALLKEISLQNTVETFILASEDLDTGELTPIVYDDEFSNPFVNVKAEDLTYDKENNEIDLSAETAKVILKGLNARAINDSIASASITLDENNLPSGITFDIPDEVAATYTRTNEISVTFDLSAEYYEVVPFANNNPELAEALTKYEDLTNYTYNKQYLEDGEVVDHITGFFTEELVYFHHGYADDGGVYNKGDNYDYLATREDDNIYYVYECTTDDGINFNWGIVMASSTTPLTYASLDEMGPSYFNISDGVFKALGDNKYEIEPSLVKTVGQYFDYGLWGVDSQAAETQTSSLVITLNSDNSIELIEMSFIADGETFDVEYYYENINSTVIPSWLNF